MLQLLQKIRSRCYNKSDKNYGRYGGRGISVCREWLDRHEAFVEWAFSNGYKRGLTIDRINVDGDYCPENCRWITNEENARWKSTTNVITVDGVTMTGKQWAAALGLGVNYINRFLRNHSMEETIVRIKQISAGDTTVTKYRKLIIINGVKMGYSDWSSYFGYDKNYLYCYESYHNSDINATKERCRVLYFNKFNEYPIVEIVMT